jgi:hypothetical protein
MKKQVLSISIRARSSVITVRRFEPIHAGRFLKLMTDMAYNGILSPGQAR